MQENIKINYIDKDFKSKYMTTAILRMRST